MKLDAGWNYCSFEAENKSDQKVLRLLYEKIKDDKYVHSVYNHSVYNHDDAEQKYPIEIYIQYF